MKNIDTILTTALKDYLKGKISYHKANMNVYLHNPVGIGEHPDILESLESELSKLAEYDEKLSTLEKYFP